MSRRGPSKVAVPRCTRQTAGKIPASQAATQVAEAKKSRSKQTRFAVSTDTTTKSSDVETIDVKEDEGDVQSLKATTAPSPGRQTTEMPRPAPGAQGLSTSSIGPVDDAGSNKRQKKASPVVWTSLGPLPRWVPGPTTRWAPGTTRLALHGT
jgi:hypothetical protein